MKKDKTQQNMTLFKTICCAPRIEFVREIARDRGKLPRR